MTPERIPLAGVVGWPVSHSLSPRLFGYWLHKHAIRGQYVPMGIRQKDFQTTFLALPKLGFRGVNVTIPYKEPVLELASSISDRAALIGAANTISFREDGSIHADNTDGEGFLRNVKASAPNWRASAGPALVLGAGGAARAIISALIAEGAPEIRICNRTRARAEFLRDQFGARTKVVDWNRANDEMREAMTIVNTTSLGMKGQPALNVSLEFAPREALVADIVYVPLETELLAEARALGMTAVDGLGMLLHQAVPGFRSWFEKTPEVDEDLRKLVLGR